MKSCVLALLFVSTCRGDESLEQYTPDQADWTTFYDKAVNNNNLNKDHSPDGIGWLGPDAWKEWDGTVYDPTEYSRRDFGKLICPGNTVLGMRKVFYDENPFADNANPTKAEVDNWHAIVVNHVRAMVNYTSEEYTIVPDKCLHIRALWSDERFHTRKWDTNDYPGTCAGSTNPHCGAGFLPSKEDQQEYLPEGIEYCPKRAGSEGMFSAAKSNIPWSIKWARPFCATLGAEGFWGGHTGPWFHRTQFGWSWFDGQPDNQNSNAGLRTKWSGSSGPSKYVNPDITSGKFLVQVEGVKPLPRFYGFACETINWYDKADNATQCYEKMMENDECGKRFMTYNSGNNGCACNPTNMAVCVVFFQAQRLTWDFEPIVSSYDGLFIDNEKVLSGTKLPYSGRRCPQIRWKGKAGDVSHCLQKIVENKYEDCGRRFLTWNTANGGCACYPPEQETCIKSETIKESGRQTYELEVDPTWNPPTEPPVQQPTTSPQPTVSPTVSLTVSPSEFPSGFSSVSPTESQTVSPSEFPTVSPSGSPTNGERIATLTVKRTAFTKPVSVEFTINDAENLDWMGIFYYSKGDDLEANPGHEDDLFWTYTCGSQESSGCDAVTDGIVTFNGVDPVEESGNQWPINPGKYKVCHMREGEDDNGDETSELLQPCKILDIKLSKKWPKKVNRATIESKKTKYTRGSKITAKFNAKLSIPNGWVGIYNATVPTNATEDESLMMWVYTGCNNVNGDQAGEGVIDEDKSNDCIKMKKKGKVNFTGGNTGRAPTEWPLPEGEYYLRLEYYYNHPYHLFQNSTKTFMVVAKE